MISEVFWSGLRDSNPRSLGPKPSAIPNFAKPGLLNYYSGYIPEKQGIKYFTFLSLSDIIDSKSSNCEEKPMRMRKKTNLVPRMEACSEYWIRNPEEYKGRWRELMPACSALHVEVGCGKGGFTVQTAAANPDVLLIAVEICKDAMVVAMDKAKEMGLKNVWFIAMDVAMIEEFFEEREMDLLQHILASILFYQIGISAFSVPK